MKKWILILLVLLLFASTAYNFLPEDKLPPNTKIERIVVLKSKRLMNVYANGNIVKSYSISLGANPVGHKKFEGDKRTPEGEYIINDKNPNSGYHKNLGVSYPNKKDIEDAKRRNEQPGGDIKIHGLRNGLGFIGKFQRITDWTLGCIALTNDEVDELYNHVPLGTSITILP